MKQYFDKKSKESINSLIKDLKSYESKGYIFRGCTNNRYKLVPGYFRESFDNWDIISEYNEIEYNTFLSLLSKYIDKNCLFEFLYQSQHCGLKTKFLDFTRNCLIALLFSCVDWKTETVDKKK